MMRRVPLFSLILFFTFSAVLAASEGDILRDYVPDGRAPRFEGAIQVWIDGQDRLEGQYYIESVLDEIGRILPAVSITQASGKSQANVCVYLTDSHEEWREAITKSAAEQSLWQEKGELIRGFTRLVSTPTGKIKRADIILHLDFQTSGGQKLWVVRHEFMHALGVTGHPRNHPDSVLNSMQPQEDKNGLFSDDDKAVLQTIYAD